MSTRLRADLPRDDGCDAEEEKDRSRPVFDLFLQSASLERREEAAEVREKETEQVTHDGFHRHALGVKQFGVVEGDVKVWGFRGGWG